MLTLTTSACAQKDRPSSQLKSDDEKIDSVFTQYFNVLDLYLKDRESDRSGRRMDAISFMERITGIYSSGTRDFTGKSSFTEENLKAWHQWYLQNRKDLVWNRKNKIVWRKKE